MIEVLFLDSLAQINKGTNFHENSANQPRNMDENVLP